jgi:hypothetical protein
MNDIIPQRLRGRIRDYLLSCRELNQFCKYDGWIDNEGLIFEILSFDQGNATVAVWFTEVITEGSRCLADTQFRFGKLRLHLDEENRVLSASKA